MTSTDAVAVRRGTLRRALAEVPALRRGLALTVVLAVVAAGGRLLVPVLTQQILDRGVLGAQGYRPAVVYPLCAAALGLVGLVYAASRFAFARLTVAAETGLMELRVRTFAHIHGLSAATQSETLRGTFTARVTSDVDQLAEFLDWGGINWVTSMVLMAGCLSAMLVYSVRLTVVVVAVVLPLVGALSLMQRGMRRAYDLFRTRVGETLGEVGELVGGAATIRAYGMEREMSDRLERAIDRQYTAEVQTTRFSATIFPLSDIFGSTALAAVVVLGALRGREWGLSFGDVVAFLFLVQLFLAPLTELSELFDQTQVALAGFRKVAGVLDVPVDVPAPRAGVDLPAGALEVALSDVAYAYRGAAQPALRHVSLRLPAGTHAAVVGATGSGKSTLARLLCRLDDPTAGSVRVGGVDLREAAPESLRSRVRLVPQDGFLFDGTVAENVRMGRPGATDDDVAAAVAALGLQAWVGALPQGIDTGVGQRGEGLSVGERQLVALVRAQIGGAGVLILDEATSAVDPQTEAMTAAAMARLGEGRTTVTIAHRLSTAIAADVVVVVDAGRVVEVGRHADLVARGGVYAGLHRSWLGTTRSDAATV